MIIILLQGHLKSLASNQGKIKTTPLVSRIAKNYSDKTCHIIVSTSNPELDLATQIKIAGKETSPQVRMGPEMVVGEGAHQENHTVIRILNKHGICELQFLAYSPEIKGGVNVNVGNIFGKGNNIVVNPISATNVNDIKIFNKHGGLMGTFKPLTKLSPPYVLTTGNFSSRDPVDEIAIASRHQTSSIILIAIYNGKGKLLSTFKVKRKTSSAETISLSKKQQQSKDLIILYQQGEKIVDIIDASNRKVKNTNKLDFLEKNCRVFESAFDEKFLAACGMEPDFSSVVDISSKFNHKKINVGEKENIFWYAFGGNPDHYDTAFSNALTNGKYVKKGLFKHLRTDIPGLAHAPNNLMVDKNVGKDKIFKKLVDKEIETYDSLPPCIWEPTFSHRWDARQKKAAEVIDKKNRSAKISASRSV